MQVLERGTPAQTLAPPLPAGPLGKLLSFSEPPCSPSAPAPV